MNKPLPITSRNHAGEVCALYHQDLAKGQEPLKLGDLIVTFRNEPLTLTGGEAPHKESSTGRVFAKLPGSKFDGSYFPGVFDLVWRPLEQEEGCGCGCQGGAE